MPRIPLLVAPQVKAASSLKSRLEPEDLLYAIDLLQHHVPDASRWLVAYVCTRVARAWVAFDPKRGVTWTYFRRCVVSAAVARGLDRMNLEGDRT